MGVSRLGRVTGSKISWSDQSQVKLPISLAAYFLRTIINKETRDVATLTVAT